MIAETLDQMSNNLHPRPGELAGCSHDANDREKARDSPERCRARATHTSFILSRPEGGADELARAATIASRQSRRTTPSKSSRDTRGSDWPP